MRDLQRSVARANMKALGMEQINKKKYVRDDESGTALRSAFSRHWRGYAGTGSRVWPFRSRGGRKGLLAMLRRKFRGQ